MVPVITGEAASDAPATHPGGVILLVNQDINSSSDEALIAQA
jgi:hypothetical protein